MVSGLVDQKWLSDGRCQPLICDFRAGAAYFRSHTIKSIHCVGGFFIISRARQTTELGFPVHSAVSWNIA